MLYAVIIYLITVMFSYCASNFRHLFVTKSQETVIAFVATTYPFPFGAMLSATLTEKLNDFLQSLQKKKS
jgi:Fe2+ transport system protein B